MTDPTPLELRLLAALAAKTHEEGLPYPRETFDRLGIAVREGSLILRSWKERGWYDYGGMGLTAGWLTDEGLAAARDLA